MNNNDGDTRRLTKKQKREARREADAARYQARLAGPLCLRCPNAKAADSAYCSSCEPMVKQRKSKTEQKRRDRFEAAGACPYCRLPKQRNTMVSLPAVSTPARWHTEGKRAPQRIAITEGDGRTRNRFTGQGRRGRMSRADEDEQDMRDAQAEVEAAGRALAHAHSQEVKSLGPISAKGVRDAALDRVNLAVRFLREILKRHGHVA